MPDYTTNPPPSTSQPLSTASISDYNSFPPPLPPPHSPRRSPSPADSQHCSIELLTRFSSIQVDDNIELDEIDYEAPDLKALAASFRRDRSTGIKVYRSARFRRSRGHKRKDELEDTEVMDVEVEVRGEEVMERDEREKERRKAKKEQRKRKREKRMKERERGGDAGRMDGAQGERREVGGARPPTAALDSDGQHHRCMHPYPHQLPL
jgi:hypothetical protein